MNFSGILTGLGSFVIIGLLHPVVIKAEYYFGKRIWPLFLFLGIVCNIGSLFMEQQIISTLCGVLGFSFFWSIHELFQQEKRVQMGWFPSRRARVSGRNIK